MICALPAAFAPVGASASSADCDGPGRLVPSLKRIGALNGLAINADAASATRQSLLSTSVTALGLRAGSGKTARAIAAAVCVASGPGTRVVFFVAVSGKPSCFSARLGGASRAGCEGSSERTSRPQPTVTSAATRSRAASLGLDIAAHISLDRPLLASPPVHGPRPPPAEGAYRRPVH